MIHPIEINIEKQYTGITKTKHVPANCVHRIAFTDADCWQHQSLRIVKQDYDAPQAYFCLIEIKTSIPLAFNIKTIVPDLFWVYLKRGGIQVNSILGNTSLNLTAKEYVLAYSSPNEYQIIVEEGLHLIFIQVISAAWLLRYSESQFKRFDKLTRGLRNRAITCICSTILTIHPKVDENILLLLNLPELSSLCQDSELYIPVTYLIEISHQDLNEARELKKNDSSLTLIDSVRTFIQKQLLQGPLPLLSQIAETYGKTTQYLTRIHKKRYNQTLENFIKVQKLEEAMRLLKTELYTPTQVFERLQYSNLSNFSNAFKKRFGISPQDVRPDNEE